MYGVQAITYLCERKWGIFCVLGQASLRILLTWLSGRWARQALPDAAQNAGRPQYIDG